MDATNGISPIAPIAATQQARAASSVGAAASEAEAFDTVLRQHLDAPRSDTASIRSEVASIRSGGRALRGVGSSSVGQRRYLPAVGSP